jgi:hypothetical protein
MTQPRTFLTRDEIAELTGAKLIRNFQAFALSFLISRHPMHPAVISRFAAASAARAREDIGGFFGFGRVIGSAAASWWCCRPDR